MKFCSFNWMIWPRISLAKVAHPVKPIIKVIVILSDPNIEDRTMVMIRKGIERRASTRKEINQSTQPPYRPLNTPRIVPITIAIAIADMLINSEFRVP